MTPEIKELLGPARVAMGREKILGLRPRFERERARIVHSLKLLDAEIEIERQEESARFYRWLEQWRHSDANQIANLVTQCRDMQKQNRQLRAENETLRKKLLALDPSAM